MSEDRSLWRSRASGHGVEHRPADHGGGFEDGDGDGGPGEALGRCGGAADDFDAGDDGGGNPDDDDAQTERPEDVPSAEGPIEGNAADGGE